jgi:hypothetical protein
MTCIATGYYKISNIRITLNVFSGLSMVFEYYESACHLDNNQPNNPWSSELCVCVQMYGLINEKCTTI